MNDESEAVLICRTCNKKIHGSPSKLPTCLTSLARLMAPDKEDGFEEFCGVEFVLEADDWKPAE